MDQPKSVHRGSINTLGPYKWQLPLFSSFHSSSPPSADEPLINYSTETPAGPSPRGGEGCSPLQPGAPSSSAKIRESREGTSGQQLAGYVPSGHSSLRLLSQPQPPWLQMRLYKLRDPPRGLTRLVGVGEQPQWHLWGVFSRWNGTPSTSPATPLPRCPWGQIDCVLVTSCGKWVLTPRVSAEGSGYLPSLAHPWVLFLHECSCGCFPTLSERPRQ